MKMARELGRVRNTWSRRYANLRPQTHDEWNPKLRLFLLSRDPVMTKPGTTLFFPMRAQQNDIDALKLSLKKYGFEIIEPQSSLLSWFKIFTTFAVFPSSVVIKTPTVEHITKIILDTAGEQTHSCIAKGSYRFYECAKVEEADCLYFAIHDKSEQEIAQMHQRFYDIGLRLEPKTMPAYHFETLVKNGVNKNTEIPCLKLPYVRYVVWAILPAIAGNQDVPLEPAWLPNDDELPCNSSMRQ